MRVDLPAPFSPTSAWISPACSDRDTSLSACVMSKRLERLRTSSNGAPPAAAVIGLGSRGRA